MVATIIFRLNYVHNMLTMLSYKYNPILTRKNHILLRYTNIFKQVLYSEIVCVLCDLIALNLGSRPVVLIVKRTRIIKMCQDIFFLNWPPDLLQIWHWIEGVHSACFLCLKYIIELVIFQATILRCITLVHLMH